MIISSRSIGMIQRRIGMNTRECNCESCSHQTCARRVPIFTGLTAEEIGKVVSLIRNKSYSKGQTLFMEGSYPENLVIINNGRVKAFTYTLEGKEQILYIFSEGDFIGEKNLLRNQQATYNVEALEETQVCMINKKEFQLLLKEHPGIGLKIMEELCSRMERLEKLVQNMGTKDAETRVNMLLLEFSGKYGRLHGDGVLIELPLSREGMANYIGVTRETISRKLSNLQEEGVIELVGNKKLLILDMKALELTV